MWYKRASEVASEDDIIITAARLCEELFTGGERSSELVELLEVSHARQQPDEHHDKLAVVMRFS